MFLSKIVCLFDTYTRYFTRHGRRGDDVMVNELPQSGQEG